MAPRDWSGLRSGCRRPLIPGFRAAFNMAAREETLMERNVCYCVYVLVFVFFTAVYDLPGNKN